MDTIASETKVITKHVKKKAKKVTSKIGSKLDKLKTLDPYQKFENEYPFEDMQVKAFCENIKQAVIIDLSLGAQDIRGEHYEQHKVSLTSLQMGFGIYKEWVSLQDENSEFVNFLKEECLVQPDEKLRSQQM